MKNIKFRIWDGTTYFFPEANRKAANHYLQFGSEGFWLYNSDGKLVASTTEEDICEQFTGLTDKNGKEIYEGDIICLDGISKWFISYSGRGFIAEPLESNKFIDQYRLENNNYLQFEVIGNIHENPDLI